MTDDDPSATRYPRSHGVPLGPLVCIVLAVAFIVLGVTLAVAQADGIIHAPLGMFSLIAAGITVTSGGAMALVAAAGVHRRLDRLEQHLAEQCEERVASAFVQNIAANGRHLSAVNQG